MGAHCSFPEQKACVQDVWPEGRWYLCLIIINPTYLLDRLTSLGSVVMDKGWDPAGVRSSPPTTTTGRQAGSQEGGAREGPEGP